MKCPRCGQEIIDNKDFCPNCGKRLRESSKDMKPTTAVLIIISLLVIGAIIVFSIMFVGTKKELKPFLKDKNSVINKENTDINLEDYYGEYTIKDITEIETNSDNNLNKDKIIGSKLIFEKNEIRFSINQTSYYLTNPSISTEKESNFKNHFTSTDTKKLYGVYVEGKNTINN